MKGCTNLCCHTRIAYRLVVRLIRKKLALILAAALPRRLKFLAVH
jgi:hypothetical protein